MKKTLQERVEAIMLRRTERGYTVEADTRRFIHDLLQRFPTLSFGEALIESNKPVAPARPVYTPNWFIHTISEDTFALLCDKSENFRRY